MDNREFDKRMKKIGDDLAEGIEAVFAKANSAIGDLHLELGETDDHPALAERETLMAALERRMDVVGKRVADFHAGRVKANARLFGPDKLFKKSERLERDRLARKRAAEEAVLDNVGA